MFVMFSVTDVEFAAATMWYLDVSLTESVEWLSIPPASLFDSLFLHACHSFSQRHVSVLVSVHGNPFTFLADASTIANLELSLAAIFNPHISMFETIALVEDTLFLGVFFVDSHVVDVFGVSNSEVVMSVVVTLEYLVQTFSWSHSMTNWASLWNHFVASVADLEISITTIVSPDMVSLVVIQAFALVPTPIPGMFLDY